MEKTMFTLIILPVILISLVISLMVRLIVRPVLNPYRIRRPYFGPYGYYGYGYGYGDPGYGYGDYGNGYGYGYGYGNGGQYGNSNQYGSPTRSKVAELQRRLARAGYYRGSVDGVLGPQTRRAIRAWRLRQ